MMEKPLTRSAAFFLALKAGGGKDAARSNFDALSS